jgi:hypothetical protein
MRSVEVVDLAPDVEGTLGMSVTVQRLKKQHFLIEAAVKAFVLAAALGMIWP